MQLLLINEGKIIIDNGVFRCKRINVQKNRTDAQTRARGEADKWRDSSGCQESSSAYGNMDPVLSFTA